ncbi:MAG: hypothetical protein JWP27_2563 [Flaviaesturariibacter sp.]|nr:hypothetical protein [Flaviaesturariibacter sp.]
MEKISLAFQNPADLVRFQKMVTSCPYRIDMTHLTLTCDCNEEEIKKALNDYGATLVTMSEMKDKEW